MNRKQYPEFCSRCKQYRTVCYRCSQLHDECSPTLFSETIEVRDKVLVK